MAQESCLPVSRREGTGKGPCRRLRAEGMLPAVVYGLGKTPTAVMVCLDDLRRFLRRQGGHGALINLSIDGEQGLHVLLRATQTDPLTHRPLHLDFYEVDMTKEVHVQVPLLVTGRENCPGLSLGGALEQMVRQLNVACLPGLIPDSISIDISGLELNQNLGVKNLVALEGVRFLDPPETTLVAIVTVRETIVEAVAEPKEAEAAAEPAAEAAGEKGGEPTSDE